MALPPCWGSSGVPSPALACTAAVNLCLGPRETSLVQGRCHRRLEFRVLQGLNLCPAPRGYLNVSPLDEAWTGVLAWAIQDPETGIQVQVVYLGADPRKHQLGTAKGRKSEQVHR